MTAPLPIADMASYLRAAGWERLPETWRGASIWQHRAGYQALVPARDGMDDSSERTLELLHTLAEVEGRPIEVIASDIAMPDHDTPFIRTHPRDLPAGEIRLAEAVRALAGVRGIIAAAARAVTDGSRPAFSGNHPPDVTHLLEDVRLGPSQPGSYVFALRVRVGPDESMLVPEESLGRRVLAGLYRSVSSARVAATAVLRGQDYSAFDNGVDVGVSANLCRGLSDLAGLQRDRPFEIGFRWARAVPADGLPPAELQFSGGMGVVLYRAANQLDHLASGGEAWIVGLIESLHDDQLGDDRWRVKVRGDFTTLPTDVESRRAMWVRLRPSDYQLALEAHRDRKPVRAGGRLQLMRRRVELLAETFGLRN